MDFQDFSALFFIYFTTSGLMMVLDAVNRILLLLFIGKGDFCDTDTQN